MGGQGTWISPKITILQKDIVNDINTGEKVDVREERKWILSIDGAPNIKGSEVEIILEG